MNCTICGKPLSPKQRSYCCADCAIIGRKLRAQEKIKPRYCLMCGQLITDNLRRQYCSDECMTAYRAPKPKKAIIRDRTNDIKKADKAALELGVSYGKFIAMQYQSRQGDVSAGQERDRDRIPVPLWRKDRA